MSKEKNIEIILVKLNTLNKYKSKIIYLLNNLNDVYSHREYLDGYCNAICDFLNEHILEYSDIKLKTSKIIELLDKNINDTKDILVQYLLYKFL